MKWLVSSQEKAFEVERREDMVKLSQPLRHTHVIRVLGLKEEFEETARGCSPNTSAISPQTAIRRDRMQSATSVSNQTH
jgi:hypothetical protein